MRELRRGSDKAIICCLAFSPNATRLVCASDHGTIHIFYAVKPLAEPTSGNKKSGLRFLKGTNKYFDSEWSFAKFAVECDESLCRFLDEN